MTSVILPADFDRVVRAQGGLVSTAQLADLGISRSAVRRRLGQDWRAVLPRVVQTFPGDLDLRRRMVAAYLYAGPDSAVTSLAAAAWHGVTAAQGPGPVHVEVPAPRGPRGAAFVVVRRTSRPDVHAWERAGLRIVSPARAVVAAAADARTGDRCRAIVIEAVQRGICTVPALRHELEAGPRAGSARTRDAVADVERGAWSVSEADLLVVLARSRVLPEIWANPELLAADGTRLPRPDAWIDEVALAVQVHSRRFHDGPVSWERTVMSDGVLAEYGISVVPLTPSAISRSPQDVLRRVERAYTALRGRPRPDVTARPL